MASLNQDIIIHNLDRFTIRFNVLDNEGVINPGDGEEAWWGVAAGSTVPSSPAASNVKIQKSSDQFSATSGAPGAVLVQNYGGLTIGDSYIQVEVQLNSGSTGTYQSGSINIALAGTEDEVHYHECVYSNNGNPESAVVIATGTLTVKPSLFTNAGYRA